MYKARVASSISKAKNGSSICTYFAPAAANLPKISSYTGTNLSIRSIRLKPDSFSLPNNKYEIGPINTGLVSIPKDFASLYSFKNFSEVNLNS
ncbi:hypothetical protein D3C86_1365200 [compost metagenome]